MHGENGDDFIIGGNGDVIFANAGDDFIELDGSVDPDLGRAFIDGNDGIDTVSLVGETNTASVQRIERVIGSAGVDELVLSDSDMMSLLILRRSLVLRRSMLRRAMMS